MPVILCKFPLTMCRVLGKGSGGFVYGILRCLGKEVALMELLKGELNIKAVSHTSQSGHVDYCVCFDCLYVCLVHFDAQQCCFIYA